MLLLSVLTAAIAPGVSYLTYLYLKDRYHSEPLHIVARMFLLGILIVLPIAIIQSGLLQVLGEGPFVFAYIISSGVEEVIKWFVLYHIIFNHTEFDEPYDGIVYAAAISLGFATMENILYAISEPASFGTLLMRALLPVSGHAVFGIMMGYYIGKAKFDSAHRRKYLAFSLLVPFFWHGLYDYIILKLTTSWMWFIVPLVVYLWIRGAKKIKTANAKSPYRIHL